MSTVITDNLTGKTSAGDVTITSEGGSATMQLQQGLAKAWVNFNGTGTIAERDSLNVSGLVDNGTGDYTVNISSSFSGANYSISADATWYAGVTGSTNTSIDGDSSNKPSTSSYKFVSYATSTDARYDPEFAFGFTHGDLA